MHEGNFNPYRFVEENHILRNYSKVTAKRVQFDTTDILPVDLDLRRACSGEMLRDATETSCAVCCSFVVLAMQRYALRTRDLQAASRTQTTAAQAAK